MRVKNATFPRMGNVPAAYSEVLSALDGSDYSSGIPAQCRFEGHVDDRLVDSASGLGGPAPEYDTGPGMLTAEDTRDD